MKVKNSEKPGVAAADALLSEFKLNVNNLTAADLDTLPDAVSAAVKNLLPPGWLMTNPQQESSDTRYLSVALAVKYSSVSRWSLSRAAARGELTLIKLGTSKSSKVLIDKCEIDRWLKSRRCR